MYISCSVSFTHLSNQALSCPAVTSDHIELSDISGFVASCSIPFENEFSSLKCKGSIFSTDDYSLLTVGDSLLQLDSYDGIDNQFYDPQQYFNVTGLTNEFITSPDPQNPDDETNETNNSAGTPSEIELLTQADYNELMIFFVGIMIVAYSVRIIRSLFVQTR